MKSEPLRIIVLVAQLNLMNESARWTIQTYKSIVYKSLCVNPLRKPLEEHSSLIFSAPTGTLHLNTGICPSTSVLGTYPKLQSACDWGFLMQRETVIKERTATVARLNDTKLSKIRQNLEVSCATWKLKIKNVAFRPSNICMQIWFMLDSVRVGPY